MRGGVRRYAMVATAALACLAAWVLVAPSALGGPVTYALVHGASMEPRLHDGDLVVLRPAASYGRRDVVGYRDPTLGRMVLHRIVGIDDGRFVTRGDNNGFRDLTTPSPDQVTGRLWLRVPHAGGLIAALRQPLPAAFLVGLVALGPLGTRRRRGDAGRDDTTRPTRGDPDARRAVLVACLVAGLALAALAGYAYSRPAVVAAPIADAYRLDGRFSYEAPSSPGATYPDGVARTGDAVFPALSRHVTLAFAYRFASPYPNRVSGRAAMDLVISDEDGWHRRLPLVSSRPLSATGGRLVGGVSLERLRTLVNEMERETGTTQSQYSVTIRPHLRVEGVVDGSRVDTRFAPRLTFRLDPSRLALAPAPDGRPVPLSVSQAGAVPGRTASAVRILGAELSITQLRAIGLFGSEIALALALLVGIPLLRALRGTEAERIRCRLGSRLIEVDGLPSVHPGGVVRVSDMSILTRIANRDDAQIMVATSQGRFDYGLVSRGILYRYSAETPRTRAVAEQT